MSNQANIEYIHCDESYGPQAMILGSLWCNAFDQIRVQHRINRLRDEYGIDYEFKWRLTSAKYLDNAKRLMDIFFNNKALEFRCIVVQNKLLDVDTVNDGDDEEAYYKFMYQLISHKLVRGNVYAVCLDYRTNRLSSRLPTLERALNSTYSDWKPLPISGIQQYDSERNDFIQMADMLVGAVSSEWNNSTKSDAKLSLAQYIREQVGMKSFVHSGSWFWKFSMHVWRPRTHGAKAS